MDVTLPVQDVPLGLIDPNPWNPNEQTERQFQAEIESILSNGFVLPCVVRQLGDRFQIIDGEHRWKAVHHIITERLSGSGNMAVLVEREVLPCVVLDVDEPEAKRLTVILNETRGHANLGDLALLLAELEASLGEDLITGLPYSQEQLADLIEMGGYTWDDGPAPHDGDFTSDVTTRTITAVLDEDAYDVWIHALNARRDDLPADPKQAAGAFITRLLATLEHE